MAVQWAMEDKERALASMCLLSVLALGPDILLYSRERRLGPGPNLGLEDMFSELSIEPLI